MSFFGIPIRNGLSLGLGTVASLTNGPGFLPSELYYDGTVQGAWYDPSDLTTLFQDSAGTTPVTAVEQAVGLMLDKSKGLVLGSELVTNGGPFTTTTGWTGNQVTLSVSGGFLVGTLTGANEVGPYQDITVVVGRTYLISAVINPVSTTNGGRLRITDAPFSNGVYSATVPVGNSVTVQCVFRPASTTMRVSISSLNGAAIGQVIQANNITVKELAGNHAYQSTSASRPTLRARYNLLTYSEQFDNAAWTKRGTATITPNDAIAPDGTLTADRLSGLNTFSNDMFNANYNTTSIGPAGVTYLPSIYIKRISTSGVFFIGNPSNSANGQWDVDLSLLPDTWVRITPSTLGVTVVNPFTTFAGGLAGIILRGVSGGALSMHIWGAQQTLPAVFPSNTYQRIGAATDYATGAAFPPYLFFDGIDDSMLTNSVDFTGTDKMLVVAGVTKQSDATAALLVELSATVSSNNGSFWVAAPVANATANYEFRSKGTAEAAASYSNAAVAAPRTNVVSGIGDIGADTSLLRVNGAQVASSASDQGTGNYGNYPIFIGRRNNATVPFNGSLFSLIIAGQSYSSGQISSTESWVAAKTPLGTI